MRLGRLVPQFQPSPKGLSTGDPPRPLASQRIQSAAAPQTAAMGAAVTSSIETLRERQASEQHEWALEQYKTLRQESLQAQAIRHSSLQWGLAVTAAAIAAGIVLATRGSEADSPALVGVQLILFGLAIPTFLLGSCLSWLGEVRRMMRTGIYVRWLEFEVHKRATELQRQTGDTATRYLAWEHALANRDDSVNVGGRDWESYLGCVLVYGGGQVVSLGIWLTFALGERVTVLGFIVPDWLKFVYAIGILAVVASIIVVLTMRRVIPLTRILGYEIPLRP